MKGLCTASCAGVNSDVAKDFREEFFFPMILAVTTTCWSLIATEMGTKTTEKLSFSYAFFSCFSFSYVFFSFLLL